MAAIRPEGTPASSESTFVHSHLHLFTNVTTQIRAIELLRKINPLQPASRAASSSWSFARKIPICTVSVMLKPCPSAIRLKYSFKQPISVPLLYSISETPRLRAQSTLGRHRLLDRAAETTDTVLHQSAASSTLPILKSESSDNTDKASI